MVYVESCGIRKKTLIPTGCFLSFPPSQLPDKVCPQADVSPATMKGIYAENFSMQTEFKVLAWISYRSFTFKLNILTLKS